MENEKQYMIDLLKTHVQEIKSLQKNGFPDYSQSDSLYQRTKTYALKYFPPFRYELDIVNIKFKPDLTKPHLSIEVLKSCWQKGIRELLIIAEAMLHDFSLPSLPSIHQKPGGDNYKIDELSKENKTLSSKIENLNSQINSINDKYLEQGNKNSIFKKYLLFGILLISLSIILWSFNVFIKWSWLEVHTKKTPIYVSAQLLIIVSLLPIIAKNKVIKFVEAALALILLLLSII